MIGGKLPGGYLLPGGLLSLAHTRSEGAVAA